MHEPDLRGFYREANESVVVSPDLKTRTLSRIEAETNNVHAANGSVTTDAPAKRRRILRYGGLGLAACLVLVSLALGLGLANPLVASNPDGRQADNSPVLTDGFVLQAFAATDGTLLAPSEDGMIVFSQDMGYSPSSASYDTEGRYTGCLFSVKGDGIVGVQASTSQGMLYRYTYEEFRIADEPEKWMEALSWDPTKRGTGTYYSEYDNVMPAKTDPSKATDDPDATVQVRLSKKLGSTIDVTMTPETSGEYRFGFWTNTPYDKNGDPTVSIIDLFDGETLTVTVKFEDGSTATKVLELHAADMKAIPIEEALGSAAGLKALPDFADADDLNTANSYLHTLYGTVVEENDGSFPGTLQDANDLEGSVDPAAELPREQPPSKQKDADGTDVILPASNILGRNGSATLAEANQTYEQNSKMPLSCGLGDGLFEISNVTGETLTNLPEGVNVYDTEFVSGGPLDYSNKCSQEAYGFTISEEGSIQGACALLAVTMDVANISSVEAPKTTYGFSSLSILDEDRSYSPLGVPLLYTDWWQHDRWSNDFVNRVTLAPGETRRMTQLFAVPIAFIDDPNLAFAVYDSFSSKPIGQSYYAFTINR